MADKRRAAAIEYNKIETNKGAPHVIAVGEGLIAEKIILLAKEHQVPIHEDIELVAKLVRCAPGSEIPPELYRAVAQVLAFLYQMNQKKMLSKKEPAAEKC